MFPREVLNIALENCGSEKVRSAAAVSEKVTDAVSARICIIACDTSSGLSLTKSFSISITQYTANQFKNPLLFICGVKEQFPLLKCFTK